MSSRMTPSIKYADLPDGLCEEARNHQARERIFTYINKQLIDGLVGMFEGKNVLEAYAGRGHVSALLSERGVNVKSTSLRQGHDASESLGHVFDVEDMDVVSAVETYKDWMDFLLVCWPTTDVGLYRALKILPKDVPIVFVGEVTDYSISPPFLGGCSTDEFFQNVHQNDDLNGRVAYESFGCAKLRVFNRNDKIKKVHDFEFSGFSF